MHFKPPSHSHTHTHVSLNPSATLARLSWVISPFGLYSRSHWTLKRRVSMAAGQSGSPADNQLACQSHGQPAGHAGVYLWCCLLLRTLTRPLAWPSVTGLLQWLSGKRQIAHRKQRRNSKRCDSYSHCRHNNAKKLSWCSQTDVWLGKTYSAYYNHYYYNNCISFSPFAFGTAPTKYTLLNVAGRWAPNSKHLAVCVEPKSTLACILQTLWDVVWIMRRSRSTSDAK